MSNTGVLDGNQEQKTHLIAKVWFGVTLILFLVYLLALAQSASVPLKYTLIGLSGLVQWIGLGSLVFAKKRRVFRKGQKIEIRASVLIGLAALMMISLVIFRTKGY